MLRATTMAFFGRSVREAVAMAPVRQKRTTHAEPLTISQAVTTSIVPTARAQPSHPPESRRGPVVRDPTTRTVARTTPMTMSPGRTLVSTNR